MTDDLIKVRTTMRPDEEIEVSPQEHADLSRQGLLVDDKRSGGKRRTSGESEES